MQKIVWTETELKGPARFEASSRVRRPSAVLSRRRRDGLPVAGRVSYRRHQGKALYERREVPPAAEAELPAGMTIARDRIVELTASMSDDGRIAWDVPAGTWTVLRFGHTSTGVENARRRRAAAASNATS